MGCPASPDFHHLTTERHCGEAAITSFGEAARLLRRMMGIVLDKTYVAGIEHIEAFGTRFFVHAVQILDIYHAYEHLGTLRHCAWHQDDPVGKAWYRARKRRLKAGYLDDIGKFMLAA